MSPSTPLQQSLQLRDWLIDGAPSHPSLDVAFLHAGQLLGRLLASPRISLAVLPTRDLVDGVHYLWHEESPDEVRHIRRAHGFLESEEHLQSPIHHVMTRLEPLHVRAADHGQIQRFPFLQSRFSEGATEYMAYPLRTRRGLVHILTALTYEPEGWPFDVQRVFANIAPALSVVTESFEVHSLLAEKETLLREIHHRVKNNLQIVSSMLSMQSHIVPSADGREALKVGQARVQAIAMVHERLYGMDNLAALQLRDYTMELIQQIERTLGQHRRIDMDIAPCIVRTQEAVPLALILNELITNALKYGTPGPDWDVQVVVERTGDRLALIVRNHSNVRTEDFTRENSLGLQLVRSLTRQVRGSLAAQNRDESVVEMRVDLPLQQLVS